MLKLEYSDIHIQGPNSDRGFDNINSAERSNCSSCGLRDKYSFGQKGSAVLVKKIVQF